jgi:hypothetical protein
MTLIMEQLQDVLRNLEHYRETEERIQFMRLRSGGLLPTEEVEYMYVTRRLKNLEEEMRDWFRVLLVFQYAHDEANTVWAGINETQAVNQVKMLKKEIAEVEETEVALLKEQAESGFLSSGKKIRLESCGSQLERYRHELKCLFDELKIDPLDRLFKTSDSSDDDGDIDPSSKE